MTLSDRLAPPAPMRLEIEYPESDGQPMAETDTHREQMTDLIFALKTFFQNDPQVYVAGNLFVYYQEGDPHRVVAPDVFVVKGVPQGDRRVYKIWEEGKGPDVVIEVTSPGTRWEDLGTKKGLYETLGVQEYFLFDPLREYLEPLLQGFRLVDRYYVPLEPEITPEGELRLTSQILKLELHTKAGRLRLFDPLAGGCLPTPAEVWDRAEAAEAELARLRAELARLREEAATRAE